MKRMIANIMATTGITLVILSLIATCYGGTMICISTVYQVLAVHIVIYAGFFVLGQFEYRYAVLETGLKLLFMLSLVLAGGSIFNWYHNLPWPVLALMTLVIFGVCLCLDTMSLLDEVKTINGLIDVEKDTIR